MGYSLLPRENCFDRVTHDALRLRAFEAKPMKQNCAKSLCEFAYTARRQVERAVYSGRQNTHYARDHGILGGRDDPALSHAFRGIATNPGVDGRCGISRVRKQPHHCDRLLRRAEAKMEYAAKSACDSLRW